MHEDHVAFSVEGMVLVLDLKPRLYSSTHTDTSLVSVFNISKVNLEADYLLNNINYYLLLRFFCFFFMSIYYCISYPSGLGKVGMETPVCSPQQPGR